MKTIRCSECHKRKSFDKFAKNPKRKNGINGICKDCKNKYNKTWYQKNSEQQRARVKRNHEKDREWFGSFIAKIKARPCHDCKKRFPPCAMDFDHRKSGSKAFLVSRFRCSENSLLRSKLMEEIEKCDVVCAVCHRIRTWNRQHPKNKVPVVQLDRTVPS